MITTLSKRTAGCVTDVFANAAERQGAYDFLEHESVDPKKVVDAAGRSGAWHCKGRDEVLVVLDGSSLTLTDLAGTKDFGSVGRRDWGGRGLKVVTALALTGEGGTLGPLHLEWWRRGKKVPRKSKHRRPEDRESHRWTVALNEAARRLAHESPRTRIHVLGDREADAAMFMQNALAGGHDFTIRANGTRKAFVKGNRRVNVRKLVEKRPRIALHHVAVRARRGRPARRVTLAIRHATIAIDMRDRHLDKSTRVPLTVVLATELRGGSSQPLNWLLYTTSTVTCAADAIAVVQRYTHRWRIEDFHRAWKTGGGCVEDTQLRSLQAVIKWSTLHAVVASRAERLKLLARSSPDLPANAELSPSEIRALLVLKDSEKKRTETIPQDDVPTMERAVRWIADLGGYVGAKSSGPPGTKTITRGLERVCDAAKFLDALIAAKKMR